MRSDTIRRGRRRPPPAAASVVAWGGGGGVGYHPPAGGAPYGGGGGGAAGGAPWACPGPSPGLGRSPGRRTTGSPASLPPTIRPPPGGAEWPRPGCDGAAGHWGGAASAGPAADGGVAGHWGPAAGAASVGPAGPPGRGRGPAAGGQGVAGGGGQPGAGGCAAGPYGAAGPCPPLVSSFHISLIGSSGQTATRACCGHMTGAGCEGRETSLRNPPNPGCRAPILLPPRHSVDNVRYSACSGRVPGRLAKPGPAECQRAALLRTRPIPRAHTDHERGERPFEGAQETLRGRRPYRAVGQAAPTVHPRGAPAEAPGLGAQDPLGVRQPEGEEPRRGPRSARIVSVWASKRSGRGTHPTPRRTPRRGGAAHPTARSCTTPPARRPPRRTTAGSSRPGPPRAPREPPRRRGRRCRPR